MKSPGRNLVESRKKKNKKIGRKRAAASPDLSIDGGLLFYRIGDVRSVPSRNFRGKISPRSRVRILHPISHSFLPRSFLSFTPLTLLLLVFATCFHTPPHRFPLCLLSTSAFLPNLRTPLAISLPWPFLSRPSNTTGQCERWRKEIAGNASSFS